VANELRRQILLAWPGQPPLVALVGFSALAIDVSQLVLLLGIWECLTVYIR
jgi:hypothetical protein